MATISNHMPDRLQAGLTWKWRISLPDFPASDGWVLTYRFSREDAHFEISSADYGDGTHLLQYDVVSTTEVKGGHYAFSAFVEKDGERHEVEYGQRDVIDPFDTDADRRSITKRLLDACEAALLAKKEGDLATVQSYDYKGRSLSEYSLTELYDERRRLAAEYARELAAEQVASGRSSGSKSRVRFIR
jgi:hypothetical protein